MAPAAQACRMRCCSSNVRTGSGRGTVPPTSRRTNASRIGMGQAARLVVEVGAARHHRRAADVGDARARCSAGAAARGGARAGRPAPPACPPGPVPRRWPASRTRRAAGPSAPARRNASAPVRWCGRLRSIHAVAAVGVARTGNYASCGGAGSAVGASAAGAGTGASSACCHAAGTGLRWPFGRASGCVLCSPVQRPSWNSAVASVIW